MKPASRNLTFVVIVLLSIAMLSACAGSPKGQPGQVPGLYKNEQYRFSLNYPEDWRAEPLRPGDVFRAAEPNEYATPNCAAGVADLKEGTVLDPKAFMDAIKANYPGSGRFKILEQEDVALNDGTPAKAFTFQWLWTDGSTMLVSSALITIKDGKFFNTVATGIVGYVVPKQLLEIVKSWKFI